MTRRVAITGLGPITPIGIGREAFWDGLSSGRSGVCRVYDVVDLDGIDVKIGAPVRDFDPLAFMDAKHARRVDRSAQLALGASSLALEDAGFSSAGYDPDRVAVITGTGIGGMETFDANLREMLDRGPRRVSPFFVTSLMPNALAGEISIQFGFRGANFGVVSACASSAHAIGLAAHLISAGLADAAVAGGAEAVLLRITFAGFARIGAVSRRNDEPERASRPFDLGRDGFVMGEGAGFVVLEDYDRAAARGARIYAELAGCGMTGDAFHITSPAEDGEGARRAIELALEQAGVAPSDVDYINAHGTSTEPNDRIETLAIKRAFGSAATKVKISSTKSQVGHLLGAAGGVEAIATLLSMEHGFIPATKNYEVPDPACDLDYTPVSMSLPIRVALSNSFGFGGQNAVLAFVKE
ncbi:MAG: beta-ketoacyl-ACP synthase II [Candidatus Bipolaricaulota bacterium]|nr:beta-ketoacyl-ACP synthase II [Candidatus Bipolaricaulota bacterium]